MVEKSATQPLRVVITTGDEPIVVNHFVEEVIARNPQRIVGMAVVGSISSMPDVTRKGKKNKNTGRTAAFLTISYSFVGAGQKYSSCRAYFWRSRNYASKLCA